jgi:hypothetical protein
MRDAVPHRYNSSAESWSRGPVGDGVASAWGTDPFGRRSSTLSKHLSGCGTRRGRLSVRGRMAFAQSLLGVKAVRQACGEDAEIVHAAGPFDGA